MEQDLSLREALAEDRLDDFVRQEEDRGAELANGSEFERVLVPLDVRSAPSTRGGGLWAVLRCSAVADRALGSDHPHVFVDSNCRAARRKARGIHGNSRLLVRRNLGSVLQVAGL